MKSIQKITPKEAFIVRHPVLRQGKPLDSCHFEGDNLESTTHFGLFVDKNIVGVVSIFKNKSDIFVVENQFQIRGMAILNEFQKNGFGQDLVKYSEKYIESKKGTLVWFNAREKAVRFYEKLGYSKFGNPFLIQDIGIHYVMHKKLG